MFVIEKFIAGLIKTYDKHPVSTEMESHGIHRERIDFWN
jgi:hypothetical protein